MASSEVRKESSPSTSPIIGPQLPPTTSSLTVDPAPFGPQLEDSTVDAVARIDLRDSSENAVERPETYSVCVGGIGLLSKKDLKEHFQKFGKILKVYVRTKRNEYNSSWPGSYAYITFEDEESARRAIEEMDRAWIVNRFIRVDWATERRNLGAGTRNKSRIRRLTYNEVYMGSSLSNRTIFCGYNSGISYNFLRKQFSSYGTIEEMTCTPARRCGFVKFVERSAAVQAIFEKNGVSVDGKVMRVAWKRESSYGNTGAGGDGPWRVVTATTTSNPGNSGRGNTATATAGSSGNANPIFHHGHFQGFPAPSAPPVMYPYPVYPNPNFSYSQDGMQYPQPPPYGYGPPIMVLPPQQQQQLFSFHPPPPPPQFYGPAPPPQREEHQHGPVPNSVETWIRECVPSNQPYSNFN